MTTIALPNSLENAFQKLSNNKENFAILNRYLRTDEFSSAVIEHRKQFTHVTKEEYRTTLEVLLSHYKAGESVGVNEVAQQSIAELDTLFETRSISKNDLLKSFIPLLRDVEIIVGEGRLTWAFLDTPSITTRAIATSKNFYTAYIQQTEAEAALKKSYREASALRKHALVVANNRKLQEDIGHQLDYLKKEDAKCRARALELGIPYSTLKEDAMRTRKKSNSTFNPKFMLFPLSIAAFVLAGFLMGPSDDVGSNQDAILGDVMYQTPISHNKSSLSVGERIWRTRYIQLYKQYGNASHPVMEKELFALSAEYMIPMARMEAITATITTEEVQP